MPRISRKELQGKKLFHVMVQGINKEKIFFKDTYKKEYIKLIKKYQEKYNILIITYCVMNNHSHILIYVDDTNDLTKFMHELNTSYANFYNKNNNRVGYVYRDRFKVQIIHDRNHLYNCIIYINNNPVKARICNLAKDYKFSGYREYNSLDKPKELIGLFNSEHEYEESHKIKYMYDMSFIEDEECIDFNIKNEVLDFLKQNKIDFIDLKENDYFLKLIVDNLKNKYNISDRKISNYLKIDRSTVKRIIQKNNN